MTDYETEKDYREAIANLEDDLRSAHALLAEKDARIAELEAHRLNVAMAVGIYYAADGHAPAAGPDAEVLGEVERLRRKAARADELEAKATSYEWDWYAAKREFGDARAKLAARIRELEAQLVEGAEIILALTGREPVANADGEIVGFVATEAKP